MTTKTYYKKVVEYDKHNESRLAYYFGVFIIGMAFGYIMIDTISKPNKLSFIFLLLVGITFIVINFFITHDRDVKYIKYECKRK